MEYIKDALFKGSPLILNLFVFSSSNYRIAVSYVYLFKLCINCERRKPHAYLQQKEQISHLLLLGSIVAN